MEHISAIFERMLERLGEASGGALGDTALVNSLGPIARALSDAELVLITGPRAVGKTSLALGIVLAVLQGRPSARIGLFAPESDEERLTDRLVAMASGVAPGDVLAGPLTEAQRRRIDSAVHLIASARQPASESLLIDDSPAPSLVAIQTAASKWSTAAGLDLIIVDPLHLVRGSPEQVMVGLKALARQLQLQVVVVDTIRRPVAIWRRSPREALAICSEHPSEIADTVLFLTEFPTENSGGAIAVEVLVAKHRNGSAGWRADFILHEPTGRLLLLDSAMQRRRA